MRRPAHDEPRVWCSRRLPSTPYQLPDSRLVTSRLEAPEPLSNGTLAGAHPGGSPGVLSRQPAVLLDESSDSVESLSIAGRILVSHSQDGPLNSPGRFVKWELGSTKLAFSECLALRPELDWKALAATVGLRGTPWEPRRKCLCQ